MRGFFLSSKRVDTVNPILHTSRMANTPEKKVKDKVVKILKSHGIYYFFPTTFGMGRSGVPDIICCFNGSFLAVECKAGKGKTTALQDMEIAAIRKSGGTALVINENNINDLEDLIHATLKI